MNELLRSLYDNYYEELPLKQMKAEIDHCHKLLIERLEKPERKLVLQIIDCQDAIADRLSMDSFFSGFRLAWELNNELNLYGKVPRDHLNDDPVALSVYQPEKKEDEDHAER